MPLSDLSDHVGYRMRAVSNAVSQAFARRLAAEGVTPAEWVVLRVLHDGDLAPTALAERMGMTRGAISKLSDRLAAKGLLDRAPGPGDRRSRSLSLTAAGRGKVPPLAAQADANDAEFFGVLTPEELATLDRLLKALAERQGLTGTPVD